MGEDFPVEMGEGRPLGFCLTDDILKRRRMI
jgi:hypothetical protein